MPILEAHNLCCTRGDRVLFEHLSLTVSPGERLHLRGPNGAGKTTLLRTLAGLTHPVAGSITWDGEAIQRGRDNYHAQLGYVGHANGNQSDLSAIENLRYWSTMAGTLSGSARLSTIAEILSDVGLSHCAQLPAKLLSQGQQRRLALARLLLNRPALWILDEPFTALDSATVDWLETMIQSHLQRDGLVIMTSHQPVAGGRTRTLDLGGSAP